MNDPRTWPSINDGSSGSGGKGNNWNVDPNTGVVRDDSGKPTFQQQSDGSYKPVNDADINRGRSSHSDRGGHPDLNPDGNINYGTPKDRGGQGGTSGTTKDGGIIDGIKNWWNKGRDKGPTGPDGTENTASWGDLAANDWSQRGKPGDGTGGGWDPTRGFRPGVDADVGGFMSGPTPAVRQAFERPIRAIRDLGNKAGAAPGLPSKGALLNHNIDAGADMVLDKAINQLKNPEDLNAMADKFENSANQIMQDNAFSMDKLIDAGILDPGMIQDMKPSTIKQFGGDTKIAATYGKGSKKSDWFADFEKQVRDFNDNIKTVDDPFSRKG